MSESREFHGEYEGRYLAGFFNLETCAEAQQVKRVLKIFDALQPTVQTNQAGDFAVNDLLTRYRLRPVLAHVEAGRCQFHLEGKYRFDVDLEWQAVDALMTVAGIGLLAHLKHCAMCERWMFARFSHQQFCNESCRQKHFRSSEEFKANRRSYMRRLYHLKKKGLVKEVDRPRRKK